MKLRVLDLVLLVVIVIGGYFAWRTGSKRYELSKTAARLSRKTGDLVISDPSLVYVQALPTQEPLHFAWRVYLPPSYNLNVRTQSGGMSSFSSSQAHEFIARVRFREDADGMLHVYTHFAGGASRSNVGDEKLAKLLHGRWGRIKVEQLGADELATLNPGRAAVLLKLALPDDMIHEAREVLPAHLQEAFVPELFKIEFGPQPLPDTAPGALPAQGK